MTIENLIRLREKESRHVIGLMSGTSCDGIDACLARITGNGLSTRVDIIGFETYPYKNEIRELIIDASQNTTGTVDKICQLNFTLGKLFADAARQIAGKSSIPVSDIDIIGSHGQTIYHISSLKEKADNEVRSTLQIAEPSLIAQETGVTTVADFRTRDIAAGGEGAPLTPYLHYRLFHHAKESRLVVNIGGISNMTYLPAGKGPEAVLAFDTGPGNMLMDGVVHDRTNGRSRMDRGGRLAGKGKVHDGLLNELFRDPFIRRRPPKTTGREVFGAPLVMRITKKASRGNG